MIANRMVKIALIQHPPVFLNLSASLCKAERLISEAAENRAGIVIFPETWLPGYPIWLDYARDAAIWNHPGAKSLYRILAHNSLGVDTEEFHFLASLAIKNKLSIVMGCHELKGNTLYNTMIFFSEKEGGYTLHRKLMPTYNEKLIWGSGDGSTLNIVKTDFGIMGGLICWEHWMPLARAAMHARKEKIHIAQWPSVSELHQLASRHYAFEGRCFVAACGTVLSKKDVMDGFETLSIKDVHAMEMLNSVSRNEEDLLMTGGSAVIAPDASYLAGPDYSGPKIIYSTLNSALIDEACMTLDIDGHYSRPDVFSLSVNEKPLQNVRFT